MYASFHDHPPGILHVAGVPITVNTDTPAVFGTTLSDEMALLHPQFGLDLGSIDDIVQNGIRAKFPACETQSGARRPGSSRTGDAQSGAP